MIIYSLPTSHNTADEFGLDENNDEIHFIKHQSVDEDLFGYPNDPNIDDEDMLNTEISDFDGIRLVDLLIQF